MKNQSAKRSKKRGAILLIALITLTLIAVAAASFIDAATSTARLSRRQLQDITTTHLCEAGVQTELISFWSTFAATQNFDAMDATCVGSGINNPKGSTSGMVGSIGSYAAGIIGYTTPDPYTRIVKVRSVGWLGPNDGAPNLHAHKIIDITAKFALQRSAVFDYTYFVNNYGWMDGFGPSQLTINGDMRANGNFNFLHGSPTVNGSVVASPNQKLLPGAPGLINAPPVKWTTLNYASQAQNQARWRPGYDSTVDGLKGSIAYENWRDLLFDSDAAFVGDHISGAVLADANGSKSWSLTALNGNPTSTLLDASPTQELAMPDLSDIKRYMSDSQKYTDQNQAFPNGAPNPNYGLGAYVQTWNTSLNKGLGGYQTVTQGGVLNGSAALIGTAAHPILIHGPVTFAQDVVIKGTVSGQGTIYAGRNVHIVGSINYANPPDFRGDPQSSDNLNGGKDMLGLAANGSVIMGDTSTFSASNTLQYMTPPFTHDRLDAAGNLIPAFNGTQKDATGFMKYQSVLSDSYIHSIAEPVDQIDAIMYTNNVGGGNLGMSGKGVQINGTLISKDEAMVVYSLPMSMNYDNRIRERGPSKKPLIDINLPRSPMMSRDVWQDQGFFDGVLPTGKGNGKGKGKGKGG